MLNKNDISYENHWGATFCLPDVSAVQNLKPSEVKHFSQIINFDIFQYLEMILRFI